MLARRIICSYAKAQQRSIKVAFNICVIYKIQLSVGICLPWPLWVAAKAMAETCSGCLVWLRSAGFLHWRSRSHWTYRFFSTFVLVLCVQTLLLEEGKDYSKECWCYGISIFMCCAKLFLFGRLSCAGIAKFWISVPVPVVPAKCKEPNLRCAVDP